MKNLLLPEILQEILNGDDGTEKRVNAELVAELVEVLKEALPAPASAVFPSFFEDVVDRRFGNATNDPN
jgi:hypothetical protein